MFVAAVTAEAMIVQLTTLLSKQVPSGFCASVPWLHEACHQVLTCIIQHNLLTAKGLYTWHILVFTVKDWPLKLRLRLPLCSLFMLATHEQLNFSLACCRRDQISRSAYSAAKGRYQRITLQIAIIAPKDAMVLAHCIHTRLWC